MKTYPTGKARLEIKGKRSGIRLGIAPKLPYDVILGRDWPFFAEVVSREKNHAECMEGKRKGGSRQ